VGVEATTTVDGGGTPALGTTASSGFGSANAGLSRPMGIAVARS